MSDEPVFLDFDADDAFGVEPADPEQVARRLHEIRLREGCETIDWDELELVERVVLVGVTAEVLEWLRRQGAL